MRRRELLSAGAVLAAGLAGCAAEPIEEENESDPEDDIGDGSDEPEGNGTDGGEGNDTVDDADVEEVPVEEGNDTESANDTDEPADDDGSSNGSDGIDGSNESDASEGDSDDDTDDDTDEDGSNGSEETDDEGDDFDGGENDTDTGGGDGDNDTGEDDGSDDSGDGDDSEDDDNDGDDDGDDDGEEDGSGDDEDNTDEDDTGDDAETETAPFGIRVLGPAGEPIEGASVRAEGPSVLEGETGGDGTYATEAPVGTYTVSVSHPDYQDRTVEYENDDEEGTVVELEAAEGAPETSGLRLVVTDTDGEPIEGASVRGEGEPLEADVPLVFTGETNSEGVYPDRIYENTYTIEVDHPDYQSRTIEYDHDEPTELVVELAPA